MSSPFVGQIIIRRQFRAGEFTFATAIPAGRKSQALFEVIGFLLGGDHTFALGPGRVLNRRGQGGGRRPIDRPEGRRRRSRDDRGCLTWSAPSLCTVSVGRQATSVNSRPRLRAAIEPLHQSARARRRGTNFAALSRCSISPRCRTNRNANTNRHRRRGTYGSTSGRSPSSDSTTPLPAGLPARAR